MRVGWIVALGMLATRATPASAAPQAVDWARGLVLAEAVGLANRHAPNPAVARGTSRRAALEAAKKLLAPKVAAVPLASGGKVGDKLEDKAIAERVEKAIAAALVVAAEPETDGAWRITMGVPIEALRQAIDGPRRVAVAGEDKGPPIVIVEGVAATMKPAIGWSVGGMSGATLWVSAVPPWAKDAPRVQAKSAKAGAIEVAGIDATTATLFVIITPN